MGKAEECNAFFEDDRRYADLINGVICNGVQLVKERDLLEADSTERKKNRDILRKAALGVNFVILGI